jgi:xylulokinase
MSMPRPGWAEVDAETVWWADAVTIIRELTARYGADEIVRRGGTPLSSQAVGPKMLWLQRHEPEIWARGAAWHNSHSFVVRRLTGEYVLDHHTASQCDSLYDIRAFGWNDDWVKDITPGMPMPRLAWPGEVVGAVSAAASVQTGLRAARPWSQERWTRGPRHSAWECGTRPT